MTLLFIPELLAHNFDGFFTKLACVLGLWVLVLLASLVDLKTGIDASKRVGNFKTTSKGLRKTVTKDLSYFALLLMLLLLDFAFSYLSGKITFFEIPVCSILGVIVIVAIESWSVQENLKKGRGNDETSPDVLQKVIDITKELGDDKVKAIINAIDKTK
ncbi:MAG: phage holin family protein [Paludibacteraceae bacterium]|nr:phage holin family protein [Paludibacteraceae bacterium]